MKYRLGDIIGIEVYRKSIIVKRRCITKNQKIDNERNEIVELSDASLKRLAFLVANTSVEFKSMMTLTYPATYPVDGQESKRHLNAFLTWLRRRYEGVNYCWFLEFQQRGAPHYHILVDIELDEPLTKIKRNNGSFWQTNWDQWQELEGAWGRQGGGMTSWEILESEEGAMAYALAYASKPTQKVVPPNFRNVGRFWGASRGVKAEKILEVECNEEQLRQALSDWEYLPPRGSMIWRELFQASGYFDPSILLGEEDD